MPCAIGYFIICAQDRKKKKGKSRGLETPTQEGNWEITVTHNISTLYKKRSVSETRLFLFRHQLEKEAAKKKIK